MVDRPPVRMLSRLPEGNLNGFGDEVDRLVDRDGPAEPEGYALIRYVSPKVELNRETGVDTAVIRIVEVEPLIGGRMPVEYDHAGEALQAIRGDRNGTQQISRADARDIAELADLRRQLEAYRDRSGFSTTELGALVLDTVPGAGPGWRDEPRIIRELLATRGELDEAALAEAVKPAPDDPDGDEPERDVDEPPNDSPEPAGDTVRGKPCPLHGEHEQHGPHAWIHEDDGQVYCPGWDDDPDVAPAEPAPKSKRGRGGLAAVPEATFAGPGQ